MPVSLHPDRALMAGTGTEVPPRMTPAAILHSQTKTNRLPRALNDSRAVDLSG